MSRIQLSKPVYMAELAKRLGVSDAVAAKGELRRVERALGVRLLFRSEGAQQCRWWTTESLIKRYCPQLIDVEPEALRAMSELKKLVLDQQERNREEVAELRTEHNRRLNALGARCRMLQSELAELRLHVMSRRRTSRARRRKGAESSKAS